MTYKNLSDAWDKAADAFLESDPMRLVRYGKCFRYIHNMDRESKLLEVGCGDGTGLLIARHLGFKNIVGVEVSKKRLKKAKDKLGNQASLLLVTPDSHLPFSNGCFDIVISAAVIEHTLEPKIFVQEIARVVRPDGYIIISSDCYQWRILQLLGIYRSSQPVDKALFPARLFQLFQKNGLRLVHYEAFPSPQNFQSFRMIGRRILNQPIIKYAIHGLKQLIRSNRLLMLDSHSSNQKIGEQSKLNYTETIDKFINETWTSKSSVCSYLKLFFSDENVFFLVKLPDQTSMLLLKK